MLRKLSNKWVAAAFLAMVCVSLTACSRPVTRVDSEALQALRKKNLQAEMKSTQETKAVDHREAIGRKGPEFSGYLTLEQAISNALEYNLDAAVKKLEVDIQEETAVGAKLKMLPSLTIDGKWSERSNLPASSSDPLFGNDGAQAFNYSRDKKTKDFGLELSWDLLDFGISYYQHRQAKNRARMAERRRERVIQNLVFDVTKTFWEAQIAKGVIRRASELVKALGEREKVLLKQLESRMVSEIDVLETAATFSEMKMQMSGFEKDLERNKHRLASLMGLREKANFEIAKADFDSPLEKMDMHLGELEKTALSQRPELFERDLEELITVDDARIATAEMAPSPSIFWRYNYDDDSHLYNSDWQEVGFKVSFELLSIPRKMSRKREVLKRKEQIKKDRLALAAAILTQLSISVVDHEDAMRKYTQATDILDKRKSLMEARRNHIKLGKGRLKDLLESEARVFFSNARALSAYADVMISKQRIYNTIGGNYIGSIAYLDKNERALDDPSVRAHEKVVQAASPAPRNTSQPKKSTVPVVSKGSAAPENHPYEASIASGCPYTLHLSSWKTLGKTRRQLRGLREQGLSAYAVRVNLGENEVWWGIYVGHFKNKQEALKTKSILHLDTAIVKKKPFANRIGSFSTNQAMTNMSRRLQELGYFCYARQGKDDEFQLLSGAFWDRKGAEEQNSALLAEGIQAQVVLR